MLVVLLACCIIHHSILERTSSPIGRGSGTLMSYTHLWVYKLVVHCTLCGMAWHVAWLVGAYATHICNACKAT